MTLSAPRKKTAPDWHPADIKAALAKRGFSLARIARENGYVDTSPSKVFLKQWPAMEVIMAGIIGMAPKDIWPTRYDNEGNPISPVKVTRAGRSRNG